MRPFFKTISASLLLFSVSGPAGAQNPTPTLAQDGLVPMISHLSENAPAHHFELGMLQTLRAIEKTLQARYDYGLVLDDLNLPILRLGHGAIRNPAPKAAQPDTLSRILDGFVADMRMARAALGAAETAGIVPFEMTLQDIWFDIDGNGTRGEAEGAMAILGPVVLGRRGNGDFQNSDAAGVPLTIRFDAADQAWLTAYTYMLSGFGNVFMAFDPAPVWRDLAAKRAALAHAPEIPNYYDPALVAQEIAALEAELNEITPRAKAADAESRSIYDQMAQLREQHGAAADGAEQAALQAQIDALQADRNLLQAERGALRRTSRLIRNELRAAELKLPSTPRPMQQQAQRHRNLFDALYILIAALKQQPDPSRIQAAHADWQAMIEHNIVFWARLAEETDNDREWIPNPSQSSVLPIDVPARLAESWQKILADAKAVLDGSLLIPHPLLPDGYGISLPAYVGDPSPLDPVEWIHGIGAYRYAAKGPMITGQSWAAFGRLTGGNAGGFALFLN